MGKVTIKNEHSYSILESILNVYCYLISSSSFVAHIRLCEFRTHLMTDIFSQFSDSHMGAKVAEEHPSSFSDSQTPRSELLFAIVRGRKPVNPHQVCLAVIFDHSLELRVELNLLKW